MDLDKHNQIIGQLQMIIDYLQDQSMPAMAHAIYQIMEYLKYIWNIG